MTTKPQSQQVDFGNQAILVNELEVAGSPIISLASPNFTVNADVAAAGTNQATAAAVLKGFTVVTGADGTKGVVLPTPAAGDVVILKGTTAGVLKVYPAGSGIINALSASAAMSLASGVIPVYLIAKSATQWYTLPLLPS